MLPRYGHQTKTKTTKRSAELARTHILEYVLEYTCTGTWDQYYKIWVNNTGIHDTGMAIWPYRYIEICTGIAIPGIPVSHANKTTTLEYSTAVIVLSSNYIIIYYLLQQDLLEAERPKPMDGNWKPSMHPGRE